MNSGQTQEDYLSSFIKDTTDHMKDNKDKFSDMQEDLHEIRENVSSDRNEKQANTQLGYINVDLKTLPLGLFYETGTQIKIKAATVAEVQAYSVVNDENPVDVTEKMNQMLSSCVRLMKPNGKVGSYKDLKDGDRLFLIFMIRELTFQQGNTVAKDIQCDSCSEEFKIHYRATANREYPKTFKVYEMPEKLKKFYNPQLRAFEFKVGEVTYRMAPPTIGIQEIFFEEIKKDIQVEKKSNVSFMKVVPYLLYDRNYITPEGIKQKEKEYKKLSMEEFQVINRAVDMMKFGIEALVQECPKCGVEVRTSFTFPEGASSIFVLSDPLTYFD
jgi:hypothetical protein